MGLAQLRQPSRLVADHSALLPVLQLYPFAMSFVYGIDPDSHLLGGWQLDPSKLKIRAPYSRIGSYRTSKQNLQAVLPSVGCPL